MDSATQEGIELPKKATDGTTMPKKAPELTALDVKRITDVGAHAVGGVNGLQIDVKPTGARSWVLRYQLAGRRHRMGLGAYPDVTLAMARDRAREAQDAVWRGEDPLAQKRAALAAVARVITFEDAMAGYLADKGHEFSSDKHRKQWESAMITHVVPKLGKKPVNEITVDDVAEMIRPLWLAKYPTAKKLRGRVETVLGWATVKGHRDGPNPARLKNNLDQILPKGSTVATVTHHPAVALDEVAKFYAEVSRRDGNAARALQFTTLTAARSGEVRGATWSEIDLKDRLWTIPAARMKSDRDHTVTLSKAAVELLMAQPRDNDLVFPAQRGGMLSDAALGACMKRIQGKTPFLDPRSNKPAVPHGLRSTFRDWLAERTDYDHDMGELALAHAVGDEVVRAYTQKRAKVACAGCDRLMAPDQVRRHRGRPSCGPTCDTRLERWRAFSGRY